MDKNDIKNIIVEVLAKSAFSYNDITADESLLSGFVFYTIKTDDPRELVGPNGEHLRALNHLVQKMLEAKYGEDKIDIMIDVNGVERKRIEQLKTTAYMMAERARFFKSSVRVDPMSPYERKIIHAFLTDSKNIKTESDGLGKERHIVIKYVPDEETNFGV